MLVSPQPPQWAEDFPRGGIISVLPRLSEFCLFCPDEAEKGLLCRACRANVDLLADQASSFFVEIMDELVTLWDEIPDGNEIAPIFVEPVRRMAIVRNLGMLELGVAVDAPEEVLAKLKRNLLAVFNPRTLAEVRLLMPNVESRIIMMCSGLDEISREAIPLIRHFRALITRFPSTTLTKDHVKDLNELYKAWSIHRPSEHWRQKVNRHLSFAQRPALRRSLFERTEAQNVRELFNTYLDASVLLGQDAEEIGSAEKLESYFKRLVRKQAEAARMDIPSWRDQGKVLSGDGDARTKQRPIWDSLPAATERTDPHRAFLAEVRQRTNLTERERQVWQLRIQENLSEVEIAARLGITQGRVSQIITAATRKAVALSKKL